MIYVIRRFIAAVLAVLLVADPLLASTAESRLWDERHAGRDTRLAAAFPESHPLNLLSAGRPASVDASALAGRPLSRALLNAVNAVPADAGTVQDLRDPEKTGAAPVVLLQDVHLNAEAQRNLARLIVSLADGRAADVMAVEGAFETFDFTPYRAFPADLRSRVSKIYLDAARLGAPSFAGITAAAAPAIVGVDDRDIYRRNVEAYRAAAPKRGAAAKILDDAGRNHDAALNGLSSRARAFDAARRSYRDETMSLGAYAQTLARLGIEPELEVQTFVAAREMEEHLNGPAVERERRIVLEKLVGKLNAAETDDLLRSSAAYRAGRLGFGSYYRRLRSLCEAKGVDLRSTPAFDAYLRYVLLADGVRGERLFAALGRMEDAFTASVPANERETLNAGDFLLLARKMLDFGLTPSEWERYRSLRGALFAPKQSHDPNCEIASSASGLLAMTNALTPFEEFYRAADERSAKMADRLASLPSSSARLLVAGGFHTPQIAAALAARKIPYVIVSPRVTAADAGSGTAYLSVFAREKTPLDRLFTGQKLFLAPPGVTVGTTDPQAAATGREMRAAMAADLVAHGAPVPVEARVAVTNGFAGTKLEVDGERWMLGGKGTVLARAVDGLVGLVTDAFNQLHGFLRRLSLPRFRVGARLGLALRVGTMGLALLIGAAIFARVGPVAPVGDVAVETHVASPDGGLTAALRMRDASTGLIPGYNGGYLGGDGRPYFGGRFDLSGESVAGIAMIARKDASQSKIFDFLHNEWQRQEKKPADAPKGFRGFASVYKVRPAAGKAAEGPEMEGEFTAVLGDPKSGPVIDTGSNLWAALYALHHARANGDPRGVAMARAIVDWAATINGDAPGVGYSPLEPRRYATYHNALYYAVLRGLMEDAPAADASRPFWTAEMAGVEGLLRKTLSDDKGLPFRGASQRPDGGYDRDATRYLESVAILMLAAGPDGMEKMGFDPKAVLEQAETLFAAKVMHGGAERSVFDFTDADGKKLTRRGPAASLEGTAQMAAIYRLVGAHYKAGDPAFAGRCEAEADRLAATLDTFQLADGSFPVAVPRVRTYADLYWTPPETIGSLSSASWRFLAGKANPLAPNGAWKQPAPAVAPANLPASQPVAATPLEGGERNVAARTFQQLNADAGEIIVYDRDLPAQYGDPRDPKRLDLPHPDNGKLLRTLLQVPREEAWFPLHVLQAAPGGAPARDVDGKVIVKRVPVVRVLPQADAAKLDLLRGKNGVAKDSPVFVVQTTVGNHGGKFAFRQYYARFQIRRQGKLEEVFELARVEDPAGHTLFTYDPDRPSLRLPASVNRHGLSGGLLETVEMQGLKVERDPVSNKDGYRVKGTRHVAGRKVEWTGFVDANWLLLHRQTGTITERPNASAGALLNSLTSFGWIPWQVEMKSGDQVFATHRLLGLSAEEGLSVSESALVFPGKTGPRSYPSTIVFNIVGAPVMRGDHATGEITIFNQKAGADLAAKLGFEVVEVPASVVDATGRTS
ncbi:MAG: hypothetical protein JO102_01880, partial [Elusimicrobia bacterium]|nr:hypothetical protein [Elusimicrobiota bacterium]